MVPHVHVELRPLSGSKCITHLVRFRHPRKKCSPSTGCSLLQGLKVDYTIRTASLLQAAFDFEPKRSEFCLFGHLVRVLVLVLVWFQCRNCVCNCVEVPYEENSVSRWTQTTKNIPRCFKQRPHFSENKSEQNQCTWTTRVTPPTLRPSLVHDTAQIRSTPACFINCFPQRSVMTPLLSKLHNLLKLTNA